MEDNLEPVEVCLCGDKKIDKHTCPYAEDIHGDYETLCSCCDNCTYECAMDI